ncbi:MAG: carbohydrate binding domain-containing protein [Candidatus Acidiferrales bacterium]
MGSLFGDAGKRWAILCLATAVSATLIYQAGKLSLAWYWGSSGQAAEEMRAARLVSGDAEAWEQLGEAAEFNFADPDLKRAITYYLRAVKENPRSAPNWIALAIAYEATGDLNRAKGAYKRAQHDYPISAEVAWQYGNFLLRQGQTAQALSEIHRALLTDPKLTPLAIRNVWNFDPDVNLILGSILPADENADFAALDFFVSMHQTQAELEAWQRIVVLAREKPIALQKAFPLVDVLIARDRGDDVQRVWREALEASRWPTAPPVDHSVVWNGGFEAPIANGGLDWRFQQTPGAYISVDSVVHHSGSRSLRVGFTGGVNLDFAHVQQIEPAQPNTVYDFQAYVRTQDISTDSGMHFEIFDPERQSQVYVLTPNMLGSTPWTPVRAKVTTSPQTHFLEVRLHRFPSRFFDNKINGTIWVDDVTLTPRPASAKRPPL